MSSSIRKSWPRRTLTICLLGFSGIALFEWRACLSGLGNYLILSEAPQSADLILVLGGDFWGPRVLKGGDLGAAAYAPLVLISGGPYQGRPEGELAIAFLAQQGYRTGGMESFAHHAGSTIEEAKALRPELARRGVHRVLLVTSGFHSRRSAIVFHLFCPGIQFISVPAPDPHYRPDGWWLDASSRRIFFSEWAKILGTMLIVFPADRIAGMKLGLRHGATTSGHPVGSKAHQGLGAGVRPSLLRRCWNAAVTEAISGPFNRDGSQDGSPRLQESILRL